MHVGALAVSHCTGVVDRDPYVVDGSEIRRSQTTWDVENPVINGMNYVSTGTGFLPSTVSWLVIVL